MLKVRSRPSAAPDEPEGAVAARQRFQRRQRARRWRAVRRLLVGLAAVALVAGLVWLVFFSDVLAVEGAEVRGADVLEAAEVEAAAQVPVGEPLATVDLDAIEARVEDLAAVRSAAASRSWPDQVRIEVTERVAVAVVSWEGQWRGLDEQGVLFRTFPARPEDLLEVQMSASTPAEALAESAAVISALPAELLGRVRFVEVGSVDGIALHLKGGALVNWGSADESEDKVAVLTVLLDRRGPAAREYDVTAPGRPTIRR